jgi:hypothetical protein
MNVKRFAYIEDGIVQSFALADIDVLPFNKRYAAEFAARCVECPPEVESGWTWDGKEFAAPVPVVKPEPQPDPRDVAIADIKAQLAALKGDVDALKGTKL